MEYFKFKNQWNWADGLVSRDGKKREVLGWCWGVLILFTEELGVMVTSHYERVAFPYDSWCWMFVLCSCALCVSSLTKMPNWEDNKRRFLNFTFLQWLLGGINVSAIHKRERMLEEDLEQRSWLRKLTMLRHLVMDLKVWRRLEKSGWRWRFVNHGYMDWWGSLDEPEANARAERLSLN